MPLTPSQEQLCDNLWDIGAIKFGAFDLKLHETYRDCPKSPIYMNLRTADHPVPEKRGPLTEVEMHMIGEEFRPILEATNTGVGIDFIVDIPDAGTPFGDQAIRVLRMSDVNRLLLTKEKLPDGKRKIGPVKELKEPRDGYVVLIDDLITGADTKLEAAEQLEAAGYTVILILVLVDRCTGGVEQLEKLGYRVVAVMTLPDILEYYFQTDRITANVRDKILDYPRVVEEYKASVA